VRSAAGGAPTGASNALILRMFSARARVRSYANWMERATSPSKIYLLAMQSLPAVKRLHRFHRPTAVAAARNRQASPAPRTKLAPRG